MSPEPDSTATLIDEVVAARPGATRIRAQTGRTIQAARRGERGARKHRSRTRTGNRAAPRRCAGDYAASRCPVGDRAGEGRVRIGLAVAITSYHRLRSLFVEVLVHLSRSIGCSPRHEPILN